MSELCSLKLSDPLNESIEALLSAFHELSSVNSLPRESCLRCKQRFPQFFFKSHVCLACFANDMEVGTRLPDRMFIDRCRRCRMYNGRFAIKTARNSSRLRAFCIAALQDLGEIKVVDASIPCLDVSGTFFRVRFQLYFETKIRLSTLTLCDVLFFDRPNVCESCRLSSTQLDWRVKVSVTSESESKRALLFLEQTVLKRQSHRKCITVTSHPKGVNFYFAKVIAAEQFSAFLRSNLPCLLKESKTTISGGKHSEEDRVRREISLELPPLSTYDLIVLPQEMVEELGLRHELAVCIKLRVEIEFIDPFFLRTFTISSTNWFNRSGKIKVFPFLRHRAEFIVKRITSQASASLERKISFTKTQVNIGTVTVEPLNGGSEQSCRSHLAYILKEGDHALGYDFNSPELTDLFPSCLMEAGISRVLVVFKKYPVGERIWRLERLRLSSEDFWGIDGPTVGLGESPLEFSDFTDEIEQNKFVRTKLTLLQNKKVIERRLLEKAMERGTSDRRVFHEDDYRETIKIGELVEEPQNNNL